jgi:hypothetical protein
LWPHVKNSSAILHEENFIFTRVRVSSNNIARAQSNLRKVRDPRYLVVFQQIFYNLVRRLVMYGSSLNAFQRGRAYFHRWKSLGYSLIRREQRMWIYSSISTHTQMLYVLCRDERRDGLPHTGEMHAVIFSFRSVAAASGCGAFRRIMLARRF